MSESYTKIIRSNAPWMSFDFHSFVQYRDLLYLMVRREFVAKYKQTILGPLWFILQPVLTALVFVFLFSVTMRVPTNDIPPVLFYFCGLLGWNFVSGSLNSIALSLLSNAELCKKVYFPRIFLPLSHLCSSFFALLIQTTVFLVLYAAFFASKKGLQLPNAGSLLWLPFFLFQLSLLSLGLGVWIAALTSKFRDFHYLLSFLMTLWMYASPISYPIELVPEQWRVVALYNPIAPAIVGMRAAFFSTSPLELKYTVISFGVATLICFSGIIYFNKVQRTFIDTI